MRPVPGAPRPEVRPGVRPSPVAVDLHYLLWARNAAPAAAQNLIGWALRRLSDRPILTNEKLNQGGVVFKPTEDVALLVEDLPIADLTRTDAAARCGASVRAADSRPQHSPRGRIGRGALSPATRAVRACASRRWRRGALVVALALESFEHVVDVAETGGGGRPRG